MEVAGGMQERISLDDTSRAFSHKSDQDLKKSKWLFRLMGSPLLVKIFSKLTLFGLKIGLPIQSLIRNTIFSQFCGGETIDESISVVDRLGKKNVGSILDYSIEGKETEEDFNKTKEEVIRIINLAAKNKSIPYTSVKITGIGRFGLLEKISSNKELSDEEKVEWKLLKERLNEICTNSFLTKVPVYFDAEESWIQPAIDDLAEEMMKIFNPEKAIVLTTLQMYRHDRLDYLKKLIDKGRKERFHIGIKLVRGAYWEKENNRAAALNYHSPVHQFKIETDKDFDLAVELCLQNVDLITLCAGTHNEASTMYLVRLMKELGIPNDHPHVYFSQLYGMSDHISFNLADAGYNVTKYLPYGPVKSVIPYLIRRAEENTAIAGQMGRELKLLTEESKRRETLRLLN